MRQVLTNAPLDKMHLSFAGCGFLGIYHVGVASCFKEYCPQMLNNKIAGASVGALVATAMALNHALGEFITVAHIYVLIHVVVKQRWPQFPPFPFFLSCPPMAKL